MREKSVIFVDYMPDYVGQQRKFVDFSKIFSAPERICYGFGWILIFQAAPSSSRKTKNLLAISHGHDDAVRRVILECWDFWLLCRCRRQRRWWLQELLTHSRCFKKCSNFPSLNVVTFDCFIFTSNDTRWCRSSCRLCMCAWHSNHSRELSESEIFWLSRKWVW